MGNLWDDCVVGSQIFSSPLTSRGIQALYFREKYFLMRKTAWRMIMSYC